MTALDSANKNSVPPQSFSDEFVEEAQKLTELNVQHEPSSSNIESQHIISEIPSDPALWDASCMPSKTRKILVERGPHQIKKFEYPINKARCRFLPSHYLKMLSNGEVVERLWLIYSIIKDAVFWFYCLFFYNITAVSDWPKKGYSDWGNLTRALTIHEKSVNHRNSFRAWKKLDI